jgi:hypothetical protein
MINADTPVFPNNVVDLISTRLVQLEPSIQVYRRPLRSTDGAMAIGVFGRQWIPKDDSREIGRLQPTIQEYMISVQAFVLNADEERGLAEHSVLSHMVRSVLYNDQPLNVGFASLSVSLYGSAERYRRSEVRVQNYVSNEVHGSFLYLSTLEFWLQTEVTA